MFIKTDLEQTDIQGNIMRLNLKDDEDLKALMVEIQETK